MTFYRNILPIPILLLFGISIIDTSAVAAGELHKYSIMSSHHNRLILLKNRKAELQLAEEKANRENALLDAAKDQGAQSFQGTMIQANHEVCVSIVTPC